MKVRGQHLLTAPLLGLLALTVSLSLAQPVGDKERKVGSAQTESAWGLHTASFETPQGKVEVNFPDDMAVHDTISGTVFATPSGKTDKERARNTDELHGFVVEMEKQETPVAAKIFKWVVPTGLAAGVAAVVLKDRAGNEVARTTVPVQPTPPSPPGRPGAPPKPTDYHLPSIGSAGRQFGIVGPFGGDLRGTSVNVGAKQAELLAESPRKLVAKSPADVVGPTVLELREGDVVAKSEFRNLAIRLDARKTKLRKGERTELSVTVKGLDGLEEYGIVPLRVLNKAPEVVSKGGGDIETINIRRQDVGPEGSFSAKRTVTALQAGAYNIEASIQLVPGFVLIALPPTLPTPREGNVYSVKLDGAELTSSRGYEALIGSHHLARPFIVTPGVHSLELPGIVPGAQDLQMPQQQPSYQITDVLVTSGPTCQIERASDEGLVPSRAGLRLVNYNPYFFQGPGTEKTNEQQAKELDEKAAKSDKNAAEAEERANKSEDFGKRLLKSAEELKPHWWEACIPLWNVEVIISGTFALVTATDATEAFRIAQTERDTAKTEKKNAENFRKQAADLRGKK